MRSRPYSSCAHVFVSGSQRSGTTLLGQLLGGHTNAILLDEHDGTEALLDVAATRHSPRLRERLLWLQSLRLARSKYQEPSTRFATLGLKRGRVSHLVWKSPNAAFRLAQIYERFASARFLVLQRDVRAVVASMLALSRVDFLGNQVARFEQSPEMQRWFPRAWERIRDTTESIEARLALIAACKMSLAPRVCELGLPVRTVVYERLIGEPRSELARIQEFCGLAEQDLTDPEHRSQLRGVGPGETVRGAPVHRDSLHRWADELTSRQQHLIWQAVGDWCEEHGYEREPAESAGHAPR